MPKTPVGQPEFRYRFGHRLRRHRVQNGYSQGGLARAIGGDLYTISRWERGITFPTYRHLTALAAALGMSEEELLAG
jgi:transcriptional regulator with XRE-family HTH domain